MFITALFKSWYETAELFSWSEFKTTCLLIAKSMYEAVREIATHFIGVPLLFLLMVYAFYGLGAFGIIGYMLFMVLLMRPSVGIKDVHYFLNKMTLLIALFALTCSIIDALALGFYQDAPEITRIVGQLVGFETMFGAGFFVASPFTVVWIFWIFDARYAARDYFVTLRQAVTMFMFHYPFFMLVYLFARFVLMPLVWTGSLFFEASGTQILVQTLGLILVILPLYIAAIRYGYIRFLRQNFGRYYYDA